MSLPKNKVTIYLDDETHTAIKAIAELEVSEIFRVAQQIVVDEVARRVHAASLLVARTAHTGISRNATESRVKASK